MPVNAGILQILRFAVPSEKIIFCGESSHVKNVSVQIGSESAASVVWKTITLPPRHTKVSHRWVADYKLIKDLFRLTGADRAGHILLTSANPSVLVALKLFIGYVCRGIMAQVIFHRNLSQLNGWRSRNPLIRIQDLRTALSMPDSGKIGYIVLEETIRNEMIKIMPSLRERVSVIDHPVPVNEGEPNMCDLSAPLRLGFLGLATEDKGFPFYVRLASEFSKKYSQRVEFHAIGSLPCDQKRLEMVALKRKPGLQKLDRDKFTQYLKELHFVCFPYQGGHYKFSASGALLDSIGWEKPFIAMRLPIFENLFSRFGDIGYLCDTETEFRETIDGIIMYQDAARYRRQTLTLRKVKESRTPKFLASKYKVLYDKLMSK